MYSFALEDSKRSIRHCNKTLFTEPSRPCPTYRTANIDQHITSMTLSKQTIYSLVGEKESEFLLASVDDEK